MGDLVLLLELLALMPPCLHIGHTHIEHDAIAITHLVNFFSIYIVPSFSACNIVLEQCFVQEYNMQPSLDPGTVGPSLEMQAMQYSSC